MVITMKENNILLVLALKYLKVFCLNSFSDRLLIQKKVYLAQKLGFDAGYHYRWYLHGPYSTALTSEIYEVIPEGVNSINDYELNSSATTILDKVNELEKHPSCSESNLECVEWYELIASIEYLKNQSSWLIDKSKAGVLIRLKEDKPKYNDEQFELAWNVLVEYSLVEE